MSEQRERARGCLERELRPALLDLGVTSFNFVLWGWFKGVIQIKPSHNPQRWKLSLSLIYRRAQREKVACSGHTANECISQDPNPHNIPAWSPGED